MDDQDFQHQTDKGVDKREHVGDGSKMEAQPTPLPGDELTRMGVTAQVSAELGIRPTLEDQGFQHQTDNGVGKRKSTTGQDRRGSSTPAAARVTN